MSVDRSTVANEARGNFDWPAALRAEGAAQREAVTRLHDLLLRAAQFEVTRRRPTVWFAWGKDLDQLARQSADDALLAVLANLGDFRGSSGFTTWARKFALLEAAVRLRRLAWQDEKFVESEFWEKAFATTGDEGESTLEQRELVVAIRECIDQELTVYQRQVLVTLVLRGVPIDVLAERWATTRGALYQALHDGRRRIRARLEERGLTVDPIAADGGGVATRFVAD